jgi:hypothetical protein
MTPPKIDYYGGDLPQVTNWLLDVETIIFEESVLEPILLFGLC